MRTSHLRTLADVATRTIAVLTVGGLAALAGTISYRHMLRLAQQNGQRGLDAHAFPLCVDGLDLIGVLVLLADRRAGRASGLLPWTVLTIGTLASIAANVAVAPDNPIARAISGWTAIALLAAAKMLAHLFEPASTSRERRTGDHDPSVSPATTTDMTAAPPTPDAPTATPPDGIPEPEDRSAPSSVGSVARRVPTTPDAYTRWCVIWNATRHHPAATREAARAHGVSLRTLQFIRAAGEAGQLTASPLQPAQPDPDAQTVLAGDPA